MHASLIVFLWYIEFEVNTFLALRINVVRFVVFVIDGC